MRYCYFLPEHYEEQIHFSYLALEIKFQNPDILDHLYLYKGKSFPLSVAKPLAAQFHSGNP